MALFGKIVSTFADKAIIPKAEVSITEFMDINYFDKNIEKKLKEYLLSKYGNEPFYIDLDRYISMNNVISTLIDSMYEKMPVQPNHKTEFKVKNQKKFLNLNLKYKNNTTTLSQISYIFGEIYEGVFWSKNQVNSHTDIGKLQNDIHRCEAESEYRDDRNLAVMQDMARDVTREVTKQLTETLSSLFARGEVTDTAMQVFGTCSTEIDDFTQKIKVIETEYQCKSRFEDALSQYFELLQSIVSTLRGQPQAQIDTLICTLNCNIALCQSNLGDIEKAFKSLSSVSANEKSTSKTYHFVYAAIIVQNNDSENYATAKDHIDRALEIDHKYHRAFLLKQYLLALMRLTDSNTNIAELNYHFTSILKANNDRRLIADYYIYRGLIYKTCEDQLSAVKDFETAMEYGYDPIIAKFNIASALYGQAVLDLPKDKRVLCPTINYSQMLSAVEILKTIIGDKQIDNQAYCIMKEQAISLYISACELLGIRHGLSPLKDFLNSKQAYETKRGLLLGSDEKLTEDELSLLDPEDQLFLHIRKLICNKEYPECKKEIENLLASDSKNLSPPIFYILLQACLILKESNYYWKYRNKAIANGVVGIPIDAMDAYAYELDGNIVKAKSIIDGITNVSNDYHMLENALRFYIRNHNDEECSKLFIRIHELWKEKSICVDDLDLFYSSAIRFFIQQHSPIAEEILSAITPEVISLKCFYHLQAIYYSAINDIRRLYNSLSYIDPDTDNFPDGFNKALCLRWLFQYDDALKACFALLEKTTNEKEKVRLYWLISDNLLLQEKYDESYVWAKKAHDLTAKNPYEQSHQKFFARTLRCGHHEGLITIMDYKREHPIVVDWFETFRLDLEKNPLIINEQLKERFPNVEDYAEQEKVVSELYHKGNMSINLVLKYYNEAWGLLFQFAETNKLNIALGDKEILNAELKCIVDDLVVDAQTLLIMSYYGCLPALHQIKHVHINYGSISTLQYYFLSSAYPYITELINWLHSAKNVVYEPDGYIDEEGILTKTFSRDFVAECNVALKNEIPYLFCDCVASKFQLISEVGISEKIQFISVSALCYFVGKNQPDQLSQMLYNLLKGCTFVSFTANTILYQIQRHNYQVSKEALQPFLICKSSYDMNSFASVYLQAISQLQQEYPDAAIALTEIILSDSKRIWKRGTYYREAMQHYSDAKFRAIAINDYVLRILRGVKQIFSNIPETLIKPYAEIQELISEKE